MCLQFVCVVGAVLIVVCVCVCVCVCGECGVLRCCVLL